MFKRLLRRSVERVKQVWGKETIWAPGEIRHWLQHPLVQERINTKITGGCQKDRFQWFLDTHLVGKLPVNRALTLGCGAGELERGLSKYNFANVHDAIDLSDEAIRLAKEAASAERLRHTRYLVDDLNAIRLQPERYDVVFGVSSIHHVERLEHLFEQVSGAMKKSAYFFLDEYIGPTKFQWTDVQLRRMNEELNRLPPVLKRSVSQPGKTKTRVIRKTSEYISQSDPSEAVRSAEIVPLLSNYFDIVELKGYGGSLLHELLYDIAGNFTEANAGSLDHLRQLFQREDELIACGELQHDFAVIVATKR